MPPYRIAEWEKHYETSETRRGKVTRMTWVAVKNKHDGEGLAQLMSLKRKGVEAFGAFILMLEVASKCDPRGTLVRDDGTAHSPQSLSAKTRAPAPSFKMAIPLLIEIGWMEDLGSEPQQLGLPGVAETSGDVRRRPENSAYPTLPNPTSPDLNGPNPTSPPGKREKTWTDEQIRAIYLAHPKPGKPKEAAKAARRALRDLPKDLKAQGQAPPENDYDWLLERTKLWAASPVVQGKLAGGEKKYLKAPAAWLNAGGHLEDPETWKEDEGGRQRTSEAGRRRAEKRGKEYDDKPSLR